MRITFYANRKAFKVIYVDVHLNNDHPGGNKWSLTIK